MIKLFERASDRLLGLVVPTLSAHADPCYYCSPIGGYQYGANCDCIRGARWKLRFRCTSCGWVSEGCKPYATNAC